MSIAHHQDQSAMPSKPVRMLGTFLLLLVVLPACASVLSATRDDDRGTLARLLRSGDSPDGGSSDGVTPLFEAIEQGNLPLVRMLVEAGADVNKLSQCRGRGVAPLHKAAIHNNLALVAYLLEKGADATAIAEEKHVLILIALSPDATDSGRMALAILQHLEAKAGHDAVLAFVNKQTPSGWTALAAAAYFGDAALVDALLTRGADVGALAKASNADWGSSDEWPPVHFAALGGHTGIIQHLVQAGADPNQLSAAGKTSAEVVAALEQRREEAEVRKAQEAREQAEQNRAFAQAFQEGLQRGYQAASSSDNPVNDDTFQRQMMEIRNRPTAATASGSARGDRTESEGSSSAADSETSSSESTSGAGESSTGAESAVGVTAAGVAAAGDAPNDAEREAADAAAAEAEAARVAEAKQVEKARLEEEERQRVAKEKLEREARVAAEKAEKEARVAAEKVAAQEAVEAYLTTMRQGIRLVATKCPGGEGRYYATGTKPNAKGGYCIDVSFRASCPGNVHVSSGVANTFLGRSGCFTGETFEISPQLPCPVDQVDVRVTDVELCD